ncbi:Zinc finger BED domain-containing protein 4 [Eumeta japonica]|uniref:Zinc finger BED domain-containing protein 4 n=1 Tax=Eumeta variegata TaxID=151549 RepID=A0A4C1V8U5_EUMVA|nr:Zinc finger BED domain-containing protein 4 [Eumeta japonica]
MSKSDGRPMWKSVQSSTYNMLERLLEQKTAVNLYSVEHGRIDTLSSSDWELMKNLTQVLKFFYEAMLDLSFDDACISIVIPLIALLNRKLQFRDENESKVMRSMKTKLHESMNRRFAYVQGHAALITLTLLDPRFKNTYLNSEEVDIAIMEIENHMRIYADNSRETAGTSDQGPSSSYRLSPYQKDGGLWDVHDKSTSQAIQSSDASDKDDLSTQVKKNIEMYLAQQRLQRNGDIYSYWDCSPFVFKKGGSKILTRSSDNCF